VLDADITCSSSSSKGISILHSYKARVTEDNYNQTKDLKLRRVGEKSRGLIFRMFCFLNRIC